MNYMRKGSKNLKKVRYIKMTILLLNYEQLFIFVNLFYLIFLFSHVSYHVGLLYLHLRIQFKKYLKMTRIINTVSAYRSLLQEDDNDLKELGIRKLLSHISLHWIDIANDINLIEALYQDPTFPNRPLVAFLLAKLYFYLNDYDEALKYALHSGEEFSISTARDEFTEILVNKCIEKFIESCRAEQKCAEHDQYKTIVDYVVKNSIDHGEYRMPLGIAIDTRDKDLFSRVLSVSEFNDFVETLLPHLLGLDIDFRNAILTKVVERVPLTGLTPSQYINILQVLQIKGDYEIVSRIIYELVKSGEKEVAYTLALEVSEIHGFNKKVLASIPIEPDFENQRKILADIIEGQFASNINNQVLKLYAHTDPHYLNGLKKVEGKYSIAHGAAILGLSMLQAFTQDDAFLKVKENLEWAAKSTHWNKFSSIASLGLIFKNHKDRSVFTKFLPENNAGDGVNHYSNGGALYGLGLLYTGTANQTIIDYITEKTTNPTLNQNEVVMHGACLGLGLTAFASGHEATAERLKDILRASTSVMGQASALALGLVYAGTNNESVISELIATASESEHEKIIRSVCIAIGLISFQSPSTEFLKNLEENPTIKLAIPFYLACAYFKTSNPSVVRKLLKLSNDISNEVKRSAILALGFVLYQDDKLISVIKMLLYSYNPYIRYGCIMSLAIGSKNTKEAIDLIWPSLTDSVDFVRQGAYIALALLLQVATNQSEPKLADFRKSIEEVLSKIHGDQMTKLGAIMAIGLLDIGGRNMSLSLTTRSGMPKLEAISGMLVFTQYWNWFPYINFIGLSLSPSMFIGVTANLKIPTSFQLLSNCKPSLFDYPPNIPKQEKKKDDKKETAKELSTTNKARARLLRKKESDMEVEVPNQAVRTPSLISTVKEPIEAEKPAKEEKAPEKKQEEPTSSILNNPVRIAEKQKQHITFVEGRYTPILPSRKIGISFLKDSDPSSSDRYLGEKEEPKKMEVESKPLEKIEQKKKEEDQLAPPEEFEYDDEKEKLIKEG